MCIPRAIYIYSNRGAYHNLHNHDFEQYVVNHLEKFVKPMNRVHTKHLFWSKNKHPWKKKFLQQFDKVPMFLDKFIYRRNHKYDGMFINVFAVS